MWRITQRESKDGWSDTPLMEMFTLCLIPLACIIIGCLLLLWRRMVGNAFTTFNRYALLTGVAAVSHFGWWFAEVLRSMHGMGL